MRSLQFLALSAALALSFQQIRTWSGGSQKYWSWWNAVSFRDASFDVLPAGQGRFWVAGQRSDSGRCAVDSPWILTLSTSTCAHHTLELWDTAGTELWRTTADLPGVSIWRRLIGTPSGDVTAGGPFTEDTVDFSLHQAEINYRGDPYSLGNGAFAGLRIERWDSSGAARWTWRLLGAKTALGYALPNVVTLDTFPDGRIAFAGYWRGSSWFLQGGDTTSLAAWKPPLGGSDSLLAGIVGILSPGGQTIWLHPFHYDARDYPGMAGVVRGKDFLLAHASTSGNAVLERFDSIGTLLDSRALTNSAATVGGMATAADGGLLLSLHAWTDTAVLSSGARLAITSDSGKYCGIDTAGRNFLLRLDSDFSVAAAVPFSGFRHPKSWRLTEAGARGWIAWSEDEDGCSDSTWLVHLGTDLSVVEISPRFGLAHGVKVQGDEVWVAGLIDGAPMTGNGGYMCASRLRFGDSAVATGLSQKSREKGHFELRAREWRYLGNGAATLSISDLSGRLEQRLTVVSGQSISLPRGVHVLQASTADEKWTRRYALP